MSSSRSTSLQNDKYMQTEGSDDMSVSARKLASTLWETKLKDLEEMGWKERVSKLGSAALQFSHPFNTPVSEVGAKFSFLRENWFLFGHFLGKACSFKFCILCVCVSRNFTFTYFVS